MHYVPSKLIFLSSHVSLTRGSSHSEGLIEVVEHLRHCAYSQTSLEPVAEARSVAVAILGLVVVVDAGHVDDADAPHAQVAHDLVLLVEASLTPEAAGQLVSEHVPGALTPPQAHHGLAPLAPGGARHDGEGEARDRDGQGQRPTASQKSLLRSFLPRRLHAYLIRRLNSCQLKNDQGSHLLTKASMHI